MLNNRDHISPSSNDTYFSFKINNKMLGFRCYVVPNSYTFISLTLPRATYPYDPCLKIKSNNPLVFTKEKIKPLAEYIVNYILPELYNSDTIHKNIVDNIIETDLKTLEEKGLR